MSYDNWKTTNPNDEWLGPDPESEEPDQAVQEQAAAHAAEALMEFTFKAFGESLRLPCGCIGKCDPYAHDTAPDWDGTPDGPYYTRCAECDGKIYEGETHKCE
jgi:hypothetical protein